MISIYHRVLQGSGTISSSNKHQSKIFFKIKDDATEHCPSDLQMSFREVMNLKAIRVTLHKSLFSSDTILKVNSEIHSVECTSTINSALFIEQYSSDFFGPSKKISVPIAINNLPPIF